MINVLNRKPTYYIKEGYSRLGLTINTKVILIHKIYYKLKNKCLIWHSTYIFPHLLLLFNLYVFKIKLDYLFLFTKNTNTFR